MEKDPPSMTDPKFRTWLLEDAQIRSLLWSRMEPNISVCVISFDNAKQVWLSLSDTYAIDSNVNRLC